VTVASALTWRPLDASDVPAVAALTARCLAVHGGLPIAAGEEFVAARYTGPGVRTRGGFDGAGGLVASAAVRPDGAGEARATAQVDPAAEGRGYGAHLLDWCLAGPEPVTVETESLNAAAERLFASRGLERVFAEQTMRFDLVAQELPGAPLPAGYTLVGWSPEVAERFFAAYEAAFADRPGFPGWPAQRWIDWICDDPEFRPEWTLLATDGGTDDGFVACSVGWVVQVGVRPSARGRGLGAALVIEALRRMRDGGGTEALLDVNVDNPARRLYARLGFSVIGRRGRCARPVRR
jgi:mycothiol synthase